MARRRRSRPDAPISPEPEQALPFSKTGAIAARHQGTILHLRVTPGSRREEILLVGGDEIRVRLKALPTKGQANTALIKLLARVLGVSSRDVEIAAGSTSRRKVVHVRHLAAREVWSRLQQASG